MESEEHVLISELKKKILQIFSDFMTRVTQFEELGAVGNRFLVGFHQGLAKCIVNELEVSVKEVTGVMQTASESKPYLMDNVTGEEFGPEATAYDEKPEITDYAAMMGIIYSMVKNDYIMQERIISSLGLKSSSGELESYTLMWSLRPFVNDEIMHQAWRLIQ
ncbi:hypothetical protein Acr_27g0006070 [Actinidia rufa]|uniref:DUF7795 domain-containing protein n=1 Tax=Actinidia rufa TaxID=165716 RepID=A0A7J0H764_9ERIC|nr:hypothetical protein Acr_27g0006070 [Actinidia rufa]